MKIEPTELYDQQVFELLKNIKYQLKRNSENKVVYSNYYSPFNKNFYNIQIIIDKLAKKNIFKVLDYYETKGVSNPDNRSVDFELEVNILNFEKYYAKYQKAFEYGKNIKLILYRDYKAELYVNGKIHKTKTNKGSDYFKVLMLLIKNKDRRTSFDEIAKIMKVKYGKNTGNERRARDAIQYIKTKFGYTGDDFIKTNSGFRLMCEVLIKN